MTIRLSPDHRLKPLFERHHVAWLSDEAADRQDIRPLRIGILNIMPHAEDYEFNLLAPMGRSILQIFPIWIRLQTHGYSSSDQAHIARNYLPYDWASALEILDGLIVTGAPVENLDFAQVTYWPELLRIFRAAKAAGTCILGICWGALALAKFLGIDKVVYPEKLFGVFPARTLVPDHPITGGMDDVFFCPQSRHAGISDRDFEAAERDGLVRLLAKSDRGGYIIAETPDHQILMHLGHQEYNSSRLLQEAERDRALRRTDVPPLSGIDPANPVNNWRANRNEFFDSWIKHVYLTTPYVKGTAANPDADEIVLATSERSIP